MGGNFWMQIVTRALNHSANLSNSDMREDAPGGEWGSYLTGGANITYGTSPQWKAQYDQNGYQKGVGYWNQFSGLLGGAMGGGGGGGLGGGGGGLSGGTGGGFGM